MNFHFGVIVVVIVLEWIGTHTHYRIWNKQQFNLFLASAFLCNCMCFFASLLLGQQDNVLYTIIALSKYVRKSRREHCTLAMHFSQWTFHIVHGWSIFGC